AVCPSPRAPWSRLAAVAAYLLSPYLHRQLDFGFHPEVMGAGFFFLAAYFLMVGRARAAYLSALPMLAMKEDAALTVFALGLFAAVALRRKRLGGGPAAPGATRGPPTAPPVMPLAPPLAPRPP